MLVQPDYTTGYTFDASAKKNMLIVKSINYKIMFVFPHRSHKHEQLKTS